MVRLHFYPERILWIGGGLIAAGILCAGLFLAKMMQADSSVVLSREVPLQQQDRMICEFHLELKESLPALPIPDIQGEMTFSKDPPRPGSLAEKDRLLVRLKKSAEFKRVCLPCRLGFENRFGTLAFGPESSSFWMELTPVNDKVECKLWINIDGEMVQSDQFVASIQECPIRNGLEFPEASAFRLLAEGLWLGKDLLGGSLGERLKISSSQLLTLEEKDWLIFKDGKWEKGEIQEGVPIAHIESISSRGVVLEGWGDDGHVRLLLGPDKGPPFKMKGEELLNSVRIRSEKQISCMLEKQCMILRLSDWVVKTDGRWKILRKEEARRAFLKGEASGELLILDEIVQQKIRGRLFNPGRTQMIPIEVAAQVNRRKGKA